jgi:hypothetical protein
LTFKSDHGGSGKQVGCTRFEERGQETGIRRQEAG